MSSVQEHAQCSDTTAVALCCKMQDRTNLAFAALQLNRDLGFSEYVYGLVRSQPSC